MNSKTRSVFEDLCSNALSVNIIARSHRRAIEMCILCDKPIPDHMLPGRLIMKMSQQDRKALSSLTSNDTVSYRPNFWASCT